ncbi:MAG TPA: hypothetical protein VG500_12355 [Gemmatimonadales bacterium]|nr:hypothetical protein [Gemmatimonadales bacterium]
MVARGARRRGGSTMGCLFSLLLFAAALYYGVHIGEVYLRYYRLLDAMRFQAQIAPTILDNAVINRRLTAAADSILGKSPRFLIDRRQRRITIQTEYSERVELPFFKHTFLLRPRAEAPL